MNYKTTMEEMKEQLMCTLKQDEQYNTINELCDDIIKTTNDKLIKAKADFEELEDLCMRQMIEEDEDL